MGLEEQVLKRLVPSDEEDRRLRATIEEVRGKVEEGIRKRGIDAVPILVGSVSRGTHLTGAEIDIFVAFPKDTPRKTLEEVGLALGEFLTDKKRMYAEHPYTRGMWNGFEVEVVPCYRITDASERMSAVDRTPLHAEYVKARLKQGQREEVRLLKAFCDGVGVYGAEAKVQGFSGYLCELLVLKHGTFRGVLNAATGWRRGETIVLEEAPAKAFAEPLVVVDPIDAERNVASALGEESLATFVHAAKAFIERPRLEFFFPKSRKPLTPPRARALLKRRGTTLLGIVLPAPPLTDDVVYPQIRKARKAVEDICRKAGFRISRSQSGLVAGRVLLLFEFEVFRLPAAEKHWGPPAWVKNSEDFLRRWRGSKSALTTPYIEGERWVVDVRRDATDAAALVRMSLAAMSLGSHLDKEAKKARLLKDDALFRDSFLSEVTRLIDPRFPWE